MNKLFIISAPSGCGKTSLIKALMQNRCDLALSVSHTTRDARDGEKNGVHYHFVCEKTFENLKLNDEFIEWAQVFDNFYGTGKTSLKNSLLQTSVIVEIDWQGARQLKEIFPDSVSIFISPPSIKELENRLTLRGDKPEVINRRMQDAESEISHAGEYDFEIINDDFEIALQELKKII